MPPAGPTNAHANPPLRTEDPNVSSPVSSPVFVEQDSHSRGIYKIGLTFVAGARDKRTMGEAEPTGGLREAAGPGRTRPGLMIPPQAAAMKRL